MPSIHTQDFHPVQGGSEKQWISVCPKPKKTTSKAETDGGPSGESKQDVEKVTFWKSYTEALRIK